MRSFQFAVNPDTGEVVLTYTEGHMHICIDFDGDEFDALVSLMNDAHLDSKYARS